MHRLSCLHLRAAAFICGLLLALTAARGQELKVSLMTVGPGSEAYEVFGHNALVFDNPPFGDGSPIAFNWGMFSFEQLPKFIWQFIMGRMEYSIGGLYQREMVADYARQRRHVTLTPLNLSPLQARRLFNLCLANDQPGSRLYRYDYYRDNCSTRVRDMIDRTTEGQLAPALKALPADGTYRWHTDRLAQSTPWLYVGLHYVMGHPIDAPLTAWEECFLPGKLQARLATAQITWEDGSVHPLLGTVVDLVPDTRGPEAAAPPLAWPLFLLAGLLWAGGIAWSAIRATQGAGGVVRWSRLACALLILLWAALCTLGGSIVTWSWLFTDHLVARNNENWLQLSPLSLPIILGAFLLALNRRPRWVTGVARVVLFLSVLGLLLKVFPGMRQPNGSIILLALPLHAATVFAFHRFNRKPT